MNSSVPIKIICPVSWSIVTKNNGRNKIGFMRGFSKARENKFREEGIKESFCSKVAFRKKTATFDSYIFAFIASEMEYENCSESS